MLRRVASTLRPNVTVLASCAAVLWLWTSCGGGARGSVATVPASSSSSPLAVLLTTDCGVEIDDQWALAHILVSPEMQLRAVVTTHAASVHYSSASSAAAAAEVIARVARVAPS